MNNQFNIMEEVQYNTSTDQLNQLNSPFTKRNSDNTDCYIDFSDTFNTSLPTQHKSHTNITEDYLSNKKDFTENLLTPSNIDTAITYERKRTEYFKCSPYEIAQVIMAQGFQFCLIDNILHIYIEEFNYWNPIIGVSGDNFIRKIIDTSFRHLLSKLCVEEIRNCIISFFDIPIITLKDFKLQKNYINFKNGMYCISESTFYENYKKPDLYFRWYVNTDYTEGLYSCKDNLHFNQYLKSTFNCKEDRDTFGEILGLCLSNIRDLKYTILCYGNHNSGKSVFFNIIDTIIGSKFTTAIPFSYFTERFSMAQLYGKSINIGSEIQDISSKKLDSIKRASGNDKMLYEYKNFDPFVGYNMTLLLFACNNLPKLSPTDAGTLFTRLHILEFPNIFERSNWKYDLTELILENPQPIIMYAIEGLHRFINNGYCFTESKNCKRLLKQYTAETNSFLPFASKYIRTNPDCITSSNSIREQYAKYCENEELDMLDVTIWSKILQRQYKAKSIRNTKSGYEVYNERAYKGIELKEVE